MTIPGGTTRRTLVKTARTATERFRVNFDGMTQWPLDADELLLDEFRFEAASGYGPAVLYSRELSAEAASVLIADIPVPVASVAPVEEPAVTIDGSTLEPLPDDEFWAVIDVLEGRAWENSLRRTESHLAAHSEEFVLRFAQTLMAKAYLLDNPRILHTYVSERGTAAIHTQRAMDERAAVIIGGRARFDDVLAHPRRPDDAWSSDSTWWLFHIADEALGRIRGERVEIRTAIPRGRVALNPEHWSGDHGIELDALPEQSNDDEVAAKLAQIETDFIEKTGTDPAFNPLRNDSLSWQAAAYFVDLGDRVVEQVAFFAAPRRSPDVEGVAAAAADRLGGVVVGRVQAHNRMMGSVFSFTITARHKMKSSLSLEAHIDRYFRGGGQLA